MFILLSACNPDIKEGHSNDHEIISRLKQFKLKEADSLIKKKDSSVLRNLFYFQKTYLDEGRNFDLFPNLDSLTNHPDFTEVVLNYSYGDYLKRSLDMDSTDFTTDSQWLYYYLKAYKISLALNDTVLLNESLKRINQHYQEVNKDIDKFSFYQRESGLPRTQ